MRAVCSGISAFVVCVLVIVGSATAGTVTKDQLPTSGMGIGPVNYFTTQWMFANAARITSNWTRSDGSTVTELTEQGYPLSVASGQWVETGPFRSNGDHYPTGQYVLKWEGTGNVDLRHNYASLVSSAPGRKVYNVTTARYSLALRITSSSASDPVRNIQLWMPGTENLGSEFHPLFKERLRGVGVLRFMDAFRTNGSNLVNWSDRTQPTHLFQGTNKGIAYEFAIDLCNELNADLWLNVPHKANNDFIRQLAALVRDRLRPDLRVWIEYSNETWNSASGFRAQYDYVAAKASEWGVGHDTAHARLSLNMFDLFTETFGSRDRIVHVMAGQSGRDTILRDRMTTAGPTGKVDVCAIQPYMNTTADMDYIYNHRDDPTNDAIFARLYQTADSRFSTSWEFAQNIAVSNQWNVPMVMFEFNNSLRPRSASYDKTFIQRVFDICRDPQMANLYKYACDKWRALGGATVVGYYYVGAWDKDTGSGQFGHLEYQDQPIDEAPTYRAFTEWTAARSGANDLDAVIKATPQPGSPLTVEFDGRDSFHTGPGVRTYHWRFGDGSTGEGPTVTHTYAQPGAYEVRLTVTDYNANNDDSTATITVSSSGGDPPPGGEPVTIQAEEGVIGGGAKVAQQYSGHTGGYVDFDSSGAYVEWSDIVANAAGDHTFSFRYAQGGSNNRNLRLVVNGQTIDGGITFTPTGSWSTWRTLEATITLASGSNTVRLQSIGQDGPNLDAVTIEGVGGSDPDPDPDPPPPTGEVLSTHQAEDGDYGGGTKIESNHWGYTGSGFANLPNSGGYLQWAGITVPHAGTYTLRFRFTQGGSSGRTVALTVNGASVTGGVTFPPTGAWNQWSTIDVPVTLSAGANAIRLQSTGQDSGNVDRVELLN